MTPLMASAFYGRPKLMKIFIKNGATLNRRNEFGDTALIMAARIHYTSLVKLLVKAGAQKNIRNNNGKTAFEEARDSLVRPFYSDCTCKHGSNHSFAEMTRLLTNREDRIRPSIHRKNNRNVAKNNNERTVVSLQYTDNTMQYYVPMVIAGHYPVLYIQQ
jgi:ankyrin repeat protein